MRSAPAIASSTVEERRAWVRKRYPCIADCDSCGICAAFHGKDPEQAFSSYIEGNEEMAEAAARLRQR